MKKMPRFDPAFLRQKFVNCGALTVVITVN